jgi:hypothetical protein
VRIVLHIPSVTQLEGIGPLQLASGASVEAGPAEPDEQAGCVASAHRDPRARRELALARAVALHNDRRALSCMEVAANRTAKEYSRYGSTTHKQVYIYGGLDGGPTELVRNFGMAWGLGGWLLTAFLQKIGPGAVQQLRERVAAEIKTTFASHYDKEVSLAEALRLEEIAIYGRKATGQKYLINPNKRLAR